MTKLELAKTAANIIVGAGTTKIVHQVIRNNTSPETVVDVATMMAGSFAIGGVVADASKSYTSAKIDKVAYWWKTNVSNN